MSSSTLSVGFQTAVLSEPGGRPVNEDWCFWGESGPNSCWIVADGLGGHKGGEVASKTAATAVLNSFKQSPALSRAALKKHIDAAQDALLSAQRENRELSEMRTTLVLLISDSRNALWAHIGDSRLYWFSKSGLVFQTEDHSVPQALAKAGDIGRDQIRGHRDRNRLLRSIGEQGPARPAISERAEPLHAGDAFLLCTDGFWENVLETEMMADLVATASTEEWLSRSECRLLARVSGTHDNYSAIAVRVTSVPDTTQRDGWSAVEAPDQVVTEQLPEL